MWKNEKNKNTKTQKGLLSMREYEQKLVKERAIKQDKR